MRCRSIFQGRVSTMQAFTRKAKTSAGAALPLFRTACVGLLFAASGCAAPQRQQRDACAATIQPRDPKRPADQCGRQSDHLQRPPAPPDTPLCGLQAREANAIGAALPSARLASIGVCASFTCYDPLTATYIGADQVRHVCR